MSRCVDLFPLFLLCSVNTTDRRRLYSTQSCATGHQSGEGPTGKRWRDERNGKLAYQQKDAESKILKGVVAYISGYTGALSSLSMTSHGRRC
jgi:hypothetical protein